jgi:CRP-like cAMP-binding protein
MPLKLEPTVDRALARDFREAGARAVRRREALYREGDPAEQVFQVEEGHVVLSLKARSGPRRARVIELVGPGELFGTEALVPEGERIYSATAGEKGRIRALDGGKAVRTLRRSRTTFNRFLRAQAEDLAHCRSRILAVGGRPTHARIAALVLELGERYGYEQDGQVIVPHRYTHSHLGDLVSCHRSTVTTLFNDWLYEGILAETRPRLVVGDPRSLGRIAARGRPAKR